MWITNAGVADWYFVVAYTDREAGYKGMTAFIVERAWKGVEVGKKEINLGQRCSDTRGITFTDVEVPEENVIGKVGGGWLLAMGAFDHTRPLVAAAAVGLARAAFEHADEVRDRAEDDGQAASRQHQAIAFMIAEMARDIEAARLLVWKAAWMKDAGEKNTMYASMAKAFAADCCHRIASDAVQVFGGYGYNTEYPVEKLLRDSKIFQIYEGTSQIQRDDHREGAVRAESLMIRLVSLGLVVLGVAGCKKKAPGGPDSALPASVESRLTLVSVSPSRIEPQDPTSVPDVRQRVRAGRHRVGGRAAGDVGHLGQQQPAGRGVAVAAGGDVGREGHEPGPGVGHVAWRATGRRPERGRGGL